MNPLVSIVIPVYNGSNYLAEAIDSALNQTYKNIEVIVVNDGSNDDGATENIALKYGDKIRYFSKENGGVSTALNRGIKEMRGDYFSWLSHDDLYTPNKIEMEIKALDFVQDTRSIIMCGTDFVDKNSMKIDRKTKKWSEGQMSDYDIYHQIFTGHSISGCALLISKRWFDEVGSFNEKYRYMQDMDMWYRILEKGGSIFSIENIGVHSRIHGSQLTVLGGDIGRKDAQEIGDRVVSHLIELQYDDILKEYLGLCYRNQAKETGKKILKYLNDKRKLTICDIAKFTVLKQYGLIRPLLIKIYYKFKWNVEAKNI